MMNPRIPHFSNALVALTLVFAAAAPGRATFPGANGKLLYSTVANEIVAINPDGTGRTVIGHGIGIGHTPVWSPDGSQIAFWSSVPGQEGLHVIDADGSDERTVHLTGASHPIRGRPSWSPDGTQLAFAVYQSVGCGFNREFLAADGIFVIDLDGSNFHRIDSDLVHPVGFVMCRLINNVEWSPTDPNIIAFGSPDSVESTHSSLRVSDDDVSTGQETNLTWSHGEAYDLSPSWSPDGSAIAFSHQAILDPHASIHIINVNGTNERDVTDSGQFGFPVWSPDGNSIVYLNSGWFLVACIR